MTNGSLPTLSGTVPGTGMHYVQYPDYVLVGGNVPWRCTNPGNLVAGTFSANNGAIGQSAENRGTFAVFPNAQVGDQAMRTLLLSRYGSYTIGDMLATYSGASGAGLNDYKNLVQSVTGLSLTTVINTLTPAQFSSLVGAMQREEGWTASAAVGTTYMRGAPGNPAWVNGLWPSSSPLPSPSASTPGSTRDADHGSIPTPQPNPPIPASDTGTQQPASPAQPTPTQDPTPDPTPANTDPDPAPSGPAEPVPTGGQILGSNTPDPNRSPASGSPTPDHSDPPAQDAPDAHPDAPDAHPDAPDAHPADAHPADAHPDAPDAHPEGPDREGPDREGPDRDGPDRDGADRDGGEGPTLRRTESGEGGPRPDYPDDGPPDSPEGPSDFQEGPTPTDAPDGPLPGDAPDGPVPDLPPDGPEGSAPRGPFRGDPPSAGPAR